MRGGGWGKAGVERVVGEGEIGFCVGVPSMAWKGLGRVLGEGYGKARWDGR